jgi:pSer/pThr/pTyr-binding forkhead associated (FHA) protein
MAIQGTRLETDEDVRRALLLHRPAARGAAVAAGAPAPADDGPPLFRPGLRPPTPLLTVYDDGSEDGEVIRIRQDRFVIGRTEGDLIIPNDSQISSRHAEIRQALVKEKYRWNLNDLKSTNGTYVRVNLATLEHGQEFILGRTRYRFENQAAAADATAPKPPNASDQGTRPWQSSARIDIVPAVVEQKVNGGGSRVLLSKSETWFGKDVANCQVVMPADPFVSARHACIRRDGEGRWLLESNKSINGVWLRIEQIPFKGTCRFMLGEQQFMIRTPA